MKIKKILIIDCHPNPNSLTKSLADEYERGVLESEHEMKRINIRDLDFDPILRSGHYDMPLEPDLLQSQELIKWCSHLVIITPVWWMSSPALLKGWLDRILTPGFSYVYRKKSINPLPIRLLKGRTARIIYTQGGPKFLTNIVGFDAFYKALKYGTLIFMGFYPVNRTGFYYVAKANPEKISKIKAKVYALGKNGR